MTATAKVTPTTSDIRVNPVEPVYGEILNVLYDEALLLDDDRQLEWLELLDDDLEYSMPIRKTVYRRDGDGYDPRIGKFNDNRLTLGLRARRNVDIPNAFDRDPAPRIRRQVSNVIVHETDVPDAYAVGSYVVAHRNRADFENIDVITAKREDVWRRDADGKFKLLRRTIYSDHTALAGRYLNLML